jgi:hypothetical protein
VGVPFAILSLVSSKLVYYLLPILPPFALLASEALLERVELGPRTRRWGRRATLALGATLLVAAPFGFALIGVERETLRELVGRRDPSESRLRVERQRVAAAKDALPVALPAIGLLGLVLLRTAGALGRGDRRATFAGLGSFTLIAMAATPWVLGRAGPAFSRRDLAVEARALAGTTGPVVCYGIFHRGVPFYLGRPAHLWKATYAEFGQEVLPGQNQFALQEDRATLDALIRDHPRIVLITKHERAAQELLETSPVPLEIADAVGRYILVIRAEAKK